MLNTRYVELAWRNISHRKTRSALTVIGIFIGISAVVALVALGSGLQNAITGEFAKMGTDKITIMSSAGGISSPMAAFMAANPLTEDDVKTVKSVRGIKLAGTLLQKGGEASFKSETKNVFIIGIPTDENQKMFEDMQNFEPAKGQESFKSTDRFVASVGSYFADGLFEKKVDVGDKITIMGKELRVVTIAKSQGNRMDDSAVIMPLDAARELLDEPKTASMIIAQITPGGDPEKIAEDVERALRKHRGLKEGNEDFVVSTSEQLMQTFSMIFGVVQAVVLGIAAISLLVGGIGIMNTMYTSVLERTKEIGIMKAIGARNGDILTIFLIESGTLGLIGGVLGVLIGAGLGKIAEAAAVSATGSTYFVADVSPELVIGSLVFSIAIGSIAGLFPARQAAMMKPVDALRYE